MLLVGQVMQELLNRLGGTPDILLVPDAGQAIQVHRKYLAAGSPVFEYARCLSHVTLIVQ
jgi:hypothetical protein